MMMTSIQIEIGNPDGGGLELTFDDFVLELSDGCNLDFVQVMMMTMMVMMLTMSMIMMMLTVMMTFVIATGT